ncbi:MAG: O-antigen ligase family protein [Acidimicrobiales bacterium]|nr:O-antigen ligase family protein [Acidimicrobiales bacterium]MCB9394064.1 O-antigen ligase family protein [Acidimicrobiaceae bacterium]
MAGIAAALGTVVLAVPASAAPDDTGGDDAGGTGRAEDVLDVRAELSSQLDPGDVAVVRVTIAADRLIDGVVRARSLSAEVTVEATVQVTGGSTEQVLLAIPVGDPGPVSVELLDGDDTIDEDQVRFAHDAGTDVAGLLPILRTRSGEPPQRVTLLGDLRRVNLVPLSTDVLDLGPAALSQLDTVLAGTDDLAAMSPEGLDHLLSWLSLGGRLVLDDADDLSTLPPDWRPDGASHIGAGLGEVRIAPGRLTAGDWDEVLVAAPLSGYDSPMGVVGIDVVIDPRVSLARRAGVELPELGTIVAVLAGYVVLVGPVLYLVLRRFRRLTAAWVAIPVLALVVSAGVVVTSRGWDTGGRPAASAIVQTSDAGGQVAVQQLVVDRSGGERIVAFPAGWTAIGRNPYLWFGGSDVARTASAGAGGLEVRARLEAGQVAVVEAEGPRAAPLLDVEATAVDADEVRGEVTNLTAVTLRSVAVFGGGTAVLIGDIEPGATASYTLAGVRADADPFDTPLRQVYNDPASGLGFGGEATPYVDLGLWSWFSSRTPDLLYPDAHVRVAAWSDELGAVDGRTGAEDDVTLVTAAEPIRSNGTMHQISMRRDWLEAAFDPNTGALQSPVAQYVLPGGIDAALELELDTGFSAVEFLDSRGRWVKRTPSGDDDVVAVPSAAVRDGVVVARLVLDQMMPMDPSSLPIPALREVGA